MTGITPFYFTSYCRTHYREAQNGVGVSGAGGLSLGMCVFSPTKSEALNEINDAFE